MAFTNIASAQITSSPLATNVVKKPIIISNQSKQGLEENSQATITGMVVWVPFEFARAAGAWIGKGLVNIFGEIASFEALVTSGLGVTLIAMAITAIVVGLMSGGDWAETWFWTSALGSSLGLGGLAGSLGGGLAHVLGATAAAPGIGWVIGGAVLLYMFLRSTVRMDERIVIVDNKVWQPQTGGEDCHACNDDDFPCTEYQCKSLGLGCELVNDGDNAECVSIDSQDITAPTITPRDDSLLSLTDYSYVPIGTNELGVEIRYDSTNGCLPSYETFTFGIELDKTGTCRFEDHSTDSFDDMLAFGEALWERNHTQSLFYPGQTADSDDVVIPVQENHEIYVRCESYNGHANEEEFLFQFCVDPVDDVSPPVIRGFNKVDNTPIRWFDETEDHSTAIAVYVNKPLSSTTEGCKWSHIDQSYKDMPGTFSSCSVNVNQVTIFGTQISYACSGTLDGLQNGIENEFYFRCNDSFGNVNTESKKLVLVGSSPLVLTSVGPVGEVRGASNLVKVPLEAETSAGFDEGIAECYHSATGNYNNYTKFENTRSNKHTDNSVYLEEDDYTYYIQCFDMAGNSVVKTIDFEVVTDLGVPTIVRTYYDGGALIVITDEPAQCVYGTSTCNYLFDDGVDLQSSDDITHSVTWSTNNNLYIKCQDDYGISPSGCSIIVRPFEFF